MEECCRRRDVLLSNPFICDHLVVNAAKTVEEFPIPDISSTIRYRPNGVDFTKKVHCLHKEAHVIYAKDKTSLSLSSVPILIEYLKTLSWCAPARRPYGN